MSELRTNRPVSHIHNVNHSEDWNSSFWTHSMPKYDSLLDKHCRRPTTSSRPDSSDRSMRLKFQSSHKKPNKPRKISNQLNCLKEELITVWDSHSIPYQHRELFYSSGKPTPNRIVREIDSLHKGSSLILKVCDHIKERERLILELQDNLANIEKASQTIKQYRIATLEAFEYIAAWTQSLRQNSYDFNWKGTNYLEKAKSDVSFILNSKIGRQLKLKKNDIFFVGNNTDIDPSTLTRINAVKRHLKLAPRVQRRLRIRGTTKKFNLSMEDSGLNEICQIFQKADVLPKIIKWIPNTSFLDTFSELYFEKLLKQYTELMVPKVAFKSFNEMLNAALSLHSSSILDAYLTESLAILIPEIEREALQDERNQEYIGIRDLVFVQVLEEEITSVITMVFADITSKDIARQISESLDLLSLVQEAFLEEVEQSHEIIYVMLDYIIDVFLDLDWLEEFVEAELVQEQLDRTRLRLPTHIQRNLFEEIKEEITERTTEEIYFGILVDFVGGFWTAGIANSAIAEANGGSESDIDLMMILKDPNIDIEEIRKNMRKKAPMYLR